MTESAWFDQPRRRQYFWAQQYSPDEYVALLATHSGHHRLPSDRRKRLLDEVRAAVSVAGSIEVGYVTDCYLLRRVERGVPVEARRSTP